MEYYSAIKKNPFESVLMRWMKLEPIIQSEVIQKKNEVTLVCIIVLNSSQTEHPLLLVPEKGCSPALPFAADFKRGPQGCEIAHLTSIK